MLDGGCQIVGKLVTSRKNLIVTIAIPNGVNINDYCGSYQLPLWTYSMDWLDE